MARPAPPPARLVLRDPRLLLAFGFGSGLAPRAPGTFGTAVAVPLYLLMAPLPVVAYLALVGLVVLAGLHLCGHAARRLGVHDHPGIVWDEIAGFLVTMAAAPAGWPWVVAGFLLFRLFDIWKPWPINLADRYVEGGFGIMLDDLIAGVYAWLALLALQRMVLWYT
jgi:phosphatidylglycerophosphatase A